MKKVVNLIVLSLCIVLSVSSHAADLRVHANETTVLCFSNPLYMVGVDRAFNVTVMVQNVSNMTAWQIGLDFNASEMQYITHSVPSDNVYGSTVILDKDVSQASNGLIVFGAENAPLLPDYAGSGKLITITFMMKVIGNTTLSFDLSPLNYLHLYTFLLYSKSLKEIPYDVANCTIQAVQYMPDVNNDGIVNVKDVSAAVIAFNSFPGTPRWNVYADVDNNGRVDIRDICLIVSNFGMQTTGTPSGGVPGIEKMEFTSIYAENTAGGYLVHLIMKNSGSSVIMIYNFNIYTNGFPPTPAYFGSYAPIENFGPVTIIQPDDSFDMQFTLPTGTTSPWYTGASFWIYLTTSTGSHYDTIYNTVLKAFFLP